jgi:hypothetical protein
MAHRREIYQPEAPILPPSWSLGWIRLTPGLTGVPMKRTIAGDGDKTIATMILNDKNGRARFPAYALKLSNKNIQRHITQKRANTSWVSTAQPTHTIKISGLAPNYPDGVK